MIINKVLVVVCCAIVCGLSGCSRQQSDWQKTRETNSADAYEQFLKKYPTGEFTAQAQARVKDLYEEREWQKARDADTVDAYQAFLKQYPEGKWTEEARIRVENFTLAQAPSGAGASPGAGAPPVPGAETSPTAPPAPPGKPAAPPPVPVNKAPPQSPNATAKQGAAPSAPAEAGSGAYGIQLGAWKSGSDAAYKRWVQLQKTYPKILFGMSPKVLPKKTSAGSIYRLQAIGLTEQHARDVCKRLRAKAQACVVVPPA